MRRRAPLLPCLALAAALLAAAPASAAPHYDIKATWGDTNLTPGGEGQFEIRARNVSEETSLGTKGLTIVERLPAKVKAKAVRWELGGTADLAGYCSGLGTQTLTCALPAGEVPRYAIGRGVFTGSPFAGVSSYGVAPAGYLPLLEVEVEVEAGAEGAAASEAILYGGEGALPDGEPCAQEEAQLASLPPCAKDVDQVPFAATPSAFGIAPGSFEADFFDREYPAGAPSRKAGAHPFELRFDFDLNARTGIGKDWRFVTSNAPLKTVEATLPRGMIGNPEALPKCDPVKFAQRGSTVASTSCPANTQVGYVNVPLPSDGALGGLYNDNEALARTPLYSLEPPRGQVADFAFGGGLVQAHIYPTLDPARGYAIETVSPDIGVSTLPRGAEAVFWGVPADPAHDVHRYHPESIPTGERWEVGYETEKYLAAGAPFEGPIRPFFTDPMDCGTDNGGARIRVDSYTHPGEFTPLAEYPSPLNVTGCDDERFRFEPKISLQPTDRHAGAPTGLDVHLEVPQRSEEVASAEELYEASKAVEAIPTPPLKKAVVTFPEGMTLSPSAAQGLGSCSPAQIGLGTDSPVSCPDNSQYGTIALHTPLLPETAPMKGFIYIAKQNDNPFHNFLSLYFVISEPERGLLIKLPGRLDLDPVSGQITTTIDDIPQQPFSDVQMTFKGGVRAGLVEPSTCGRKTIEATFYTWQDPATPHPVKSFYEIAERPDGSPCVDSLAERPFAPSLEAGTLNPLGGAYSPFALRLTRTDSDQELSRLGVTLPQGLAAKFAGVGICPEAGIAQALARETSAGAGALEQSDPSCPASSQVGTTVVGTGVGVPLSWVPGKVYLSGPYKGAPMSLVVISPAIVGPYDLGVITVRTALNVNPETAQGEALSDPFPLIFQGIPARIRDIRLKLDRPEFTLNPTSCAEKRIEAHVTGTGGNLASTADDTTSNLTNRFRAVDCASLAFKPKLNFRLFGGTKRGAHPKLRAVVTYPRRGSYANIAAASVALPPSEFLDNDHLDTICTRFRFAEDNCPKGSVIGHAVARTPLFEEPLKGPVYLRSSRHKLPDLVAALRGPDSQPVQVDLVGRVDSVRGGIRNSFELVPDAPVSKFTLTMKGGEKGLLVNSTDLCKGAHRATARFAAQNGKRRTLRPKLRAKCGNKR